MIAKLIARCKFFDNLIILYSGDEYKLVGARPTDSLYAIATMSSTVYFFNYKGAIHVR